MFEAKKLKKEIEALKKEIDSLEQKRSRSQAALVQAILMHKEPEQADADFFNQFTTEIEAKRSRIHELQDKLENN